MSKKKLIVVSFIAIILVILPVVYFGVMSIVSPAPEPIIPPKPKVGSFTYNIAKSDRRSIKLDLFVNHEYVNQVVAVVYQSVAFLIIGNGIVSSVMNFTDKEKSKEQKWKEFYIKLIIVLIISIVLMLLAKIIWDLGAIQKYIWH